MLGQGIPLLISGLEQLGFRGSLDERNIRSVTQVENFVTDSDIGELIAEVT
jgi:hypothetical protein